MINDLCGADWSKTQSAVALSSGEAELNAAVNTLSEMIGLRVLLTEVIGSASSLSLHVDSFHAKGCYFVRVLENSSIWLLSNSGAKVPSRVKASKL